MHDFQNTASIRRRFRHVLAVFTVLALLIVPAAAEDDADNSFQELRPPTPFLIGSRWEEKEVTVRSGENTLRGTLTRPKETEDAMPVAILLHGVNSDRRWCSDIAWCLADHGIASVRFDFNGHGESDGAQEDMTISSEVQDTLAILDYVKSLNFTDMDRIIMIGKSMGGAVATLAAEQCGDEIRAMCLWYPGYIVSVSTKFGFFLGARYMPWDPPETLEIAGYTYGKAFLTEAAQLDFRSAMESYDNPVLIVHGDHDYIAPLPGSLWAERIFPDCTLYIVPGGSHGFRLSQEVLALDEMIQFLSKAIS